MEHFPSPLCVGSSTLVLLNVSFSPQIFCTGSKLLERSQKSLKGSNLGCDIQFGQQGHLQHLLRQPLLQQEKTGGSQTTAIERQ